MRTVLQTPTWSGDSWYVTCASIRCRARIEVLNENATPTTRREHTYKLGTIVVSNGIDRELAVCSLDCLVKAAKRF